MKPIELCCVFRFRLAGVPVADFIQVLQLFKLKLLYYWWEPKIIVILFDLFYSVNIFLT
jgi:hypothetical protein